MKPNGAPTRREFKEYKRSERREFADYKASARREFNEYRRVTMRELKIQAREYERRLIQLNGEHKTNIDNWLVSVRKDAFEEFKKLVDERVDQLRRSEDKRAGGLVVLRILAGSGALGLLLAILNTAGITKTSPVTPPTPQIIYVPAAPGTLLPSTPQQQVPR